jgi:hypothetical protein
MPHTIITKDGTAFAFHKYELPPLGPREVRIQVTFAAPNMAPRPTSSVAACMI